MKDEPLTRRKGAQPISEPAPKHRPEHAPTVIHDPTADETILARWVRESMAKGPRFWLPVGAAAVGLVVLWMVVSTLGTGPSAASQDWNALLTARDVEDQVKVAEDADGVVAGWALLQAAEERFREALNDLPNNRDAALPLLSSAHDLFQQAREKAPADSPARRFAAIGMARALEARGDLEGAIQQYQDVAKSFPNTDEAKRAEELAARLKTPEAIAFYQKFSSFKPPELTIPPRGTSGLDLPGLPGLPGLPPNHPPLDGPTRPAPDIEMPASGLPPLLAPSDSSDVPPPAPPPAAEPPATAPQP